MNTHGHCEHPGRFLILAAIVSVITIFCFHGSTAYPDNTLKLSSPPLPKEALAGLSVTDTADLEAGKIVVLKQDSGEGRSKKSLIKASLIFDRPIDEVWRLIKCTECQKQYLPDLRESKLVKSSSDDNITEFLLKITVFNIRYRVYHKFQNDIYRAQWHLDPGYNNDLKELYGYWQFYRLDDNRTLARYGSKVDVGVMIPGFIEDYLTRKDLPKALDAVKKWVDSDGKYRKGSD